MADDKKRELEEENTTTNENEEQSKKKLKVEEKPVSESVEDKKEDKKESTTSTTEVEKKEEDKKEDATKEEEKKSEEKKPEETKPLFSFGSTPGFSFGSTGGFSFGSTFPTQPGSSPFSFNLNTTSSFTSGFSKTQTPESSGSGESNTTEGGELSNGCDEPENNSFKPVIQAQQIETKTGEEDETSLFSVRAKLYVIQDSQYKERGTGLCRINKNLENKSRIIMNIDGSKKIILNTNIFSKMKVDTPSEKSAQFVAFDLDNKFTTFLLKMGKADDIKTFVDKVNEQVKAIKELEEKESKEKKEETKVEEKKE